MHTKDGPFHGKQKLQIVDAELQAAGIEKLLLAEIYFDDGAPVTGLVRLREGMRFLATALLARSEDQIAAFASEDLRQQLDAAVRCACAVRNELNRRGIELAIDLKEGVVLPLERAVTAGGPK